MIHHKTAVWITLLVCLATVSPPPATARWATGPWDFDIVDFSVSPSNVAPGSPVTLTVYIQNVGNEIGTVHVYAGIEPPSGPLGRHYLDGNTPKTIYDIAVGQ